MNKQIETLAKEIKKLNTVSFKTIIEIGMRIEQAQNMVEGDEFQEFCNFIGISKADCSRYVAVYNNKETFEQFPQLQELGTGKIFALLSIIKEGNIGDFIRDYGINTSMAQMKKNIKSFRTGGTGEDGDTTEKEDIEELKRRIAELEAENNNLKMENTILQRKANRSNPNAKIDKQTTKKLLKFVHPDRYQKFGEEVTQPMTEASKIINGLAG